MHKYQTNDIDGLKQENLGSERTKCKFWDHLLKKTKFQNFTCSPYHYIKVMILFSYASIGSFNPFTATSRDRAIMVNYHRDVSKREKMHLSESERIF